jgi:prepilin-type N-terminal cleavage/methylation domain-containing protein
VTEGSFTLIELLIVIGILAILVAAVVVTLNPAQLLAQARDSKRQQDLSALNQALNTITALDQSLFMGTSSIVYTSLPDSTTTCANWNLPSLPSGWQYHCAPTSTLQNTDGTGWIPVNFKTTGVVSLSSLPIDPQNTSSTGLYYTYVTGGSFQLASHFESVKYQATEGSDAMYTVGSNTTLAPFLSGLVGWWKFDEASGTTAYDSSGYNNNGTMYASTTPTDLHTANCHHGYCVTLTASNFNLIDIPGTASSSFNLYPGTRTVVMWESTPNTTNINGYALQQNFTGAITGNLLIGSPGNYVVASNYIDGPVDVSASGAGV